LTGSHKATEELDAMWLSPDTIEVSSSEQHPAADGSTESAAAVCTKVVGEDHSRVAQLFLLRGQTVPHLLHHIKKTLIYGVVYEIATTPNLVPSYFSKSHKNCFDMKCSEGFKNIVFYNFFLKNPIIKQPL
jgi:hypothetical protein